MHPSTFPIVTPTTFPSDVPSGKPSDNPSIHPLQDRTDFPSLVQSIQASESPTHVPSVYSSSRPSYGPSGITILNTSLNPSVPPLQTPSEPPIAHFSSVLLLFSPSHITINVESTESRISTNDVSFVTAEYLDGYLRNYLPK